MFQEVGRSSRKERLEKFGIRDKDNYICTTIYRMLKNGNAHSKVLQKKTSCFYLKNIYEVK